MYSKTCLKRPLKNTKIGFQDRLSLNAGQGEHSAILSTFIELPFVIKILFCLCLRGRLRQVLLYLENFAKVEISFHSIVC